MTTQTSPAPGVAVHRFIPMVHVQDVDASLAFYALLGFAPVSVLRDPAGRSFWARAASRGAEIMFSRASGPIDPTVQAVLFYMYSENVASLRTHLLASGLAEGGRYAGQAGPNDGRRVVFETAHPSYMPAGEFRVADPDGYCILVGQIG
jgi:hypothetical protein